MSDFSFSAVPRMEHGKAATRRLRREHKVPAIIYGAHLDPSPISLEHKDLIKAFGYEAVFSKIVRIHIGDKTEQAVIKAVERHHIKPIVLHVDFQRVDPKEKITMHVPIHFVGEEQAPGIKAGGMISHLLKDLEIKCLPGNLPQYIEIDVSQLGLDQSIHVMDIRFPDGVEFGSELSADHNPPIVSIHRLRGAKEEVPTATVGSTATPSAAASPAAAAKPAAAPAKKK